jgi:hypothetical protein
VAVAAAFHSAAYRVRYHLLLRNQTPPSPPAVRFSGRHSDEQFGEMAASMMLSQNGIVYGEDIGHLRFEGSSLFFEGLQTSFSIAKSRLKLTRSVQSPFKFGEGQKPALQVLKAIFMPSGLPPYLLRLAYQEDGVEFELGFLQLAVQTPYLARQEIPRFEVWLQAPSEPAVVEVLPPRTPPKTAISAALRSMALPVLVAEGLGYLVATGINLAVLHSRLSSEHAPKGLTDSQQVFGSIFQILFVVIVGEVLLIGYIWSILPLIRAVRRYRFAKERSD